ncbi:hypothetical protein FJ981_05860 [Mesorhizobium sp. B1-1-4]|nr:hypothetical protein FJ981_05860 [Mesorhizobium sp. B1-1-4]
MAFCEVGAAPHPPAGTFSPYGDGEKGDTATPLPLAAVDNWRKSRHSAPLPVTIRERMPAGR